MSVPSEASAQHLIIGGGHPTAVGQSLRDGAVHLKLPHRYLDYDAANHAPRLIRALCWRFLGRRPPRLRAFNRAVINECLSNGVRWVHCAGNLALTASTLQILKEMGVRSSIWLTDDPWNEVHRSSWVMEALPHYDLLFSPRRANLDQLSRLAPGRTIWLPFGYDPRYFHPEPDAAPPLHDLFFAGGADAERAEFMAPLIQSGLQMGLYGAYWDRYLETREAFRGYAAPSDLAGLIARSRVSLCLVRRANRDGHCMRTYELAAAGTCILAEDTPEHRELFGADGENVTYFSTSEEAAEKCRTLLATPDDRERMTCNVRNLMANDGHTYADRLSSILNACNASALSLPI